MFCSKHNGSAEPVIRLLNVIENDQFSYSIVLIRGEISNYNHRDGVNHLQIVNKNNETAIECTEITNEGKFKMAIELALGVNHLSFQFCCVTCDISLSFKRREMSQYLLKIVYIICQNHDGRYQAPNDTDNSIENACGKIDLAIRMVQCLFAEMLAKHGFERKVFEFIECQPFYSSLSVDEARQWSPNQLWMHHAKEMLAQASETDHRYKYFGILASTICENGTVKGNAALGIGDVAIIGSGTLYAWPLAFDSIQRCFQDETKVNGKQLMNDSNGRNTFGGCYATALGTICHEIGHIFDLGHTVEGIMGNDIDYVNRMFTIERCPRDLPRRKTQKCANDQDSGNSVINQRVTTIKRVNSILINYHSRRNDELTFLAENCAVLLNYHKWFNQNDCAELSFIRYNCQQKIVQSVLPLILIELRTKENGMCTKYYRFNVSNNVINFLIGDNQNGSDVFEQNYDLIAIDSNGHIMKWSY